MTPTPPATGMTTTVPIGTRSAARSRSLMCALSLVALASAGCSKQDDSKAAHLSRANEYFAADQYGKAEQEYRDVLRLDPADPTAVRQLGVIYLDQGQVAQAYPLLRRAAELRPDDPDVQLKLGQILLVLPE